MIRNKFYTGIRKAQEELVRVNGGTCCCYMIDLHVDKKYHPFDMNYVDDPGPALLAFQKLMAPEGKGRDKTWFGKVVPNLVNLEKRLMALEIFYRWSVETGTYKEF